jgi:hypothetical protein
MGRTRKQSSEEDIFQKALEVLGDAREQHLQALVQRNDFSPFVTSKLRKELVSFQGERAKQVVIDGKAASKTKARFRE